MLRHERRDFLSSLVCLCLGMLFCLGSIRYGDIRSGMPNAGFFPCIGGLALILLSVIQLLSSLARRRAANANQRSEEPFFPQQDSWRRLLLALCALFVYGLTIEVLGLLVTTFLFIVFIMKFIEPQKWVTSVMMGVITSGLSYVLFNLWLKIGLPKGILGI